MTTRYPKAKWDGIPGAGSFKGGSARGVLHTTAHMGASGFRNVLSVRGETWFFRQIHFKPGCWEWLGHKNDRGWGRFGGQQAHRVAFEIWVGPIPVGLTIDHLCRNRGCVNPDHLEAVSTAINVLRGETITAANLAKTHCPQGHPYDEQNTLAQGGRRYCRECMRERCRRYYHQTRKHTRYWRKQLDA